MTPIRPLTDIQRAVIKLQEERRAEERREANVIAALSRAKIRAERDANRAAAKRAANLDLIS